MEASSAPDGIQRARLQAGTLEILDLVFRVFHHAAQSLVRVRHVVPAVQIIVHVDFPIAVQRVDAAVEIVEIFRKLERRHEFRHFTQKFLQRPCRSVEIHEDKVLPAVDAYGNQAIVRPVEVAHTVEFHHALQCAIIPIGPPVIGAAELFGASLFFRDHRGGMVAANVVERAELCRLRCERQSAAPGSRRW